MLLPLANCASDGGVKWMDAQSNNITMQPCGETSRTTAIASRKNALYSSALFQALFCLNIENKAPGQFKDAACRATKKQRGDNARPRHHAGSQLPRIRENHLPQHILDTGVVCDDRDQREVGSPRVRRGANGASWREQGAARFLIYAHAGLINIYHYCLGAGSAACGTENGTVSRA